MPIKRTTPNVYVPKVRGKLNKGASRRISTESASATLSDRLFRYSEYQNRKKH